MSQGFTLHIFQTSTSLNRRFRDPIRDAAFCEFEVVRVEGE